MNHSNFERNLDGVKDIMSEKMTQTTPDIQVSESHRSSLSTIGPITPSTNDFSSSMDHNDQFFNISMSQERESPCIVSMPLFTTSSTGTRWIESVSDRDHLDVFLRPRVGTNYISPESQGLSNEVQLNDRRISSLPTNLYLPIL